MGEEVGVGSTNDKGGHGAAVTKDGFPHVLVDLVDVLVGEGEVQAIFAGFRENLDEGSGGEILELVDVEVEVPAFVLGRIDAGQRAGRDLRDERRRQRRPPPDR